MRFLQHKYSEIILDTKLSSPPGTLSMNLRDLQLFLHLSGTLHFGKTSRACHLSPSSLSRIVKRLEDEVDAELFERDRRVVRLTDAGDHLCTYARSVLDGWGDLKERLDESAGSVRGEVRI